MSEAGWSEAGWNQIRAEVAEGSRLTAMESRLVISEITRLREQLAAKDLEWADLAMKQTGDVIAALGRAELAEEQLAAAEQRAILAEEQWDNWRHTAERAAEEHKVRAEAAEQRAAEATAGAAGLRAALASVVEVGDDGLRFVAICWGDAGNTPERVELVRSALAADDLGARWLAAVKRTTAAAQALVDWLDQGAYETTEQENEVRAALAEWRALKGE